MTRHDDRGVTTLFVVLMMPLLLAFGAFVFDGARGIVARRETQNAADAGALAKATDCAKGVTTTAFGPYETNGATLANAPACGDGTTTVSMTKQIDLVIWPGGGTRNVARSATARWGTIGTITTVPITISSCEFSEALLDGTTDVVIYLDDTKPQSGCVSLPGGFSQLADPDQDCDVTATAGETLPGDPGGDLVKQVPCLTPLPYDVLIPMYDAAACLAGDCVNGHGPYLIDGFAMFHVTGYSFNGINHAGTLGVNCPEKDRGKYCIRGDFIRFVTEQGSPGPSDNFGTTHVYLSS